MRKYFVCNEYGEKSSWHDTLEQAQEHSRVLADTWDEDFYVLERKFKAEYQTLNKVEIIDYSNSKKGEPTP